MICPKCGKEVPDNWNYCSKCGYVLKSEKKSYSLPDEKQNENKTQVTKKNDNILTRIIVVGLAVILICNFLKPKEKDKDIQNEQQRVEVQTELQAEVQTETQTELQAEARTEAQTELQTDIQTEPQTDEIINMEEDSWTIGDQNAPIWSNAYILWYITEYDYDMVVYPYAELAASYIQSFDFHPPTLVYPYASFFGYDTSELEEEGNVSYVKYNEKILGDEYYSITMDKTNYLYQGDLEDNRPSGLGCLWECYHFYDYGVWLPIYIGEFSKGVFSGTGILYDDKYFADFNDWYPEIRELEKSLELSITEENAGDFAETYLWPIKYIGEFSGGKIKGEGVMIDAPHLNSNLAFHDSRDYSDYHETYEYYSEVNVGVRVGKFSSEGANGICKVYNYGWLRYEGEFKDDVYNGEGTLYFPVSEQVQYSGGWKNGVYDGQGTLYDENGDIIYEGKWADGDYAS